VKGPTGSLPTIFYDRFVGKTLPFLANKGWDRQYGGLFETLDRKGASTGVKFRRVMVHARQLFVFSRFAELTNDENFRNNADQIFNYMKTVFWDEENGGWISKVNLDGSILDDSKDLYAHAFVIFGLANYRTALKKPEAQVWIDKTLTVLENNFSRADGSYCENMTRHFVDQSECKRNQNPHMHLLEAALYLLECDKESFRYLTLVKRLLYLFETKFLVNGSKTVLEYLNNDFMPEVLTGFKVEPGHHFEWAWLLNWSGKLLFVDRYRLLGETLLQESWKAGWDTAFGGVYDQIDFRNDSVLLETKRIWPLLELLKALSVFPDFNNENKMSLVLNILLERYIQPNGFWIERLHKNWTKPDYIMPTSSAYHIAMALLETRGFILRKI